MNILQQETTGNQVAFKIRSIISPEGQALVQVQIGDSQLLLTPESAGEIALNLLSESYNAKAASEVWAYIHESNAIEVG